MRFVRTLLLLILAYGSPCAQCSYESTNTNVVATGQYTRKDIVVNLNDGSYVTDQHHKAYYPVHVKGFGDSIQNASGNFVQPLPKSNYYVHVQCAKLKFNGNIVLRAAYLRAGNHEDVGDNYIVNWNGNTNGSQDVLVATETSRMVYFFLFIMDRSVTAKAVLADCKIICSTEKTQHVRSIAVGDWFRNNVSCKIFIAKFACCGTLINFLFGAAKIAADPIKAVTDGVKEAISSLASMGLGYKILIGTGLVIACVGIILCYFYRWGILQCVCGHERKISLKKFAHRPARRFEFRSDYSQSSSSG